MKQMEWVDTYVEYLSANLADVTKQEAFGFLQKEYMAAVKDLTTVLEGPDAAGAHDALEQVTDAIYALAKLDFVGQAISQVAQEEGEQAATLGARLCRTIKGGLN